MSQKIMLPPSSVFKSKLGKKQEEAGFLQTAWCYNTENCTLHSHC
jgi:hypothetical protein